VTKPVHLTEEALLELATGRLSHCDQLAVEAHLEECEFCRKRHEQVKFACSAFLSVAKLGLKEVTEPPLRQLAVPPPGVFAFPWKPLLAITLCCVCVFAFLFYPRTVSTVSAAELLSSAVQYENRADGARAFRVQVHGETCAGGQLSETMVSFENSLRCGHVLRQIQKSPWGHGNPLSANTYVKWRNSLGRHHDQVTKREASYEIRTSPDGDAIREATLELRTTDYHATKLTLDFSDDEEISILEATEPLPAPQPTPLADIVTKKKPATPQHIDDPNDLLEVQAWMTLRQLNADSGWEAIVFRNGPQVQVKAVVNDEERRQQLFKGFAANHGIGLKILLLTDKSNYEDILPNRGRPAGNEPGLAERWLEQQFPEGDARARFSNTTLHLSQQIVGRAFFIDKLQQRQRTLRRCSCAKDLSDFTATEKQVLSGLQEDLYRSLEPLIGSVSNSPLRPMTLVEARDLDKALEDLLSASTGQDEAAFDSRVQQIRSVL
jgi:hypothetical protein